MCSDRCVSACVGIGEFMELVKPHFCENMKC